MNTHVKFFISKMDIWKKEQNKVENDGTVKLFMGLNHLKTIINAHYNMFLVRMLIVHLGGY